MSTTLSSPPGYHLECSDPELERALRRWLDDSCLIWPGSFRIVARLVPALEEIADARQSYPEPGVEIQAGPPHDTVRIRWTTGPAVAVVHAREPLVEVHFTPAALERFEVAERGFLLVALVFVLRRLGWYHAHGAALLDPAGRGWMLVGNCKTGKSTTTALLASHGWAVSTDDIAFLARHDARIVARGFRSPIALREGGRELLATRGHLPGGGSELARRQKTAYTPEGLGGRWAERIVPEILLFPTIGTDTRVEPMRPREILSELVIWSRWVLYEALHSQEHLDVLGTLAAQATAYRTTFGPDLIQDPSLLQDLIP